MADLNLLGPAIVGLFLAALGLSGLAWMNRNRPILHLSTAEEEPDLPFDEPTLGVQGHDRERELERAGR